MKIFLSFILCLFIVLSQAQSSEKDLIEKYYEQLIEMENIINRNVSVEEKSTLLNHLENSPRFKYADEYLKTKLTLYQAKIYFSTNGIKHQHYLNLSAKLLSKHSEYYYLRVVENYFNYMNAFNKKDCHEVLSILSKNQPILTEAKKYIDTIDVEFSLEMGKTNALMCLGKNNEAISLLLEMEKKGSFNKGNSPDDIIRNKGYVLGALAYLHGMSKNYEESIKYQQKEFKLLQENNLYPQNQVICLHNMAFNYKKLGQYNESLSTLLKAKNIAEKNQLSSPKNLVYSSLTTLLIEAKKYDEAKSFSIKVLNDTSDINDLNIAQAQEALGIVFDHEKKYDSALIYSNLALSYFEKINDKKRLSTAYKNVSKIYISLGKNEEANQFLIKKIALDDSLTLASDIGSLQKTLIEYETEKKDKEIIILTQENKIKEIEIKAQHQLIFLIVAIGLLVIIIFSLYLFLNKKINHLRNLQLRSQLNRSQLNPHFINNVFAKLQGMLFSQHNEEQMLDFTSSISKFSRYTLESSIQDEWALKDELEMINEYVSLQKFMGDHFQFNVSLDANIDTNLMLPSFITQPFIENAIKHGGYSNEKKGNISLTINNKNDVLHFRLENSIEQKTKKNEESHISRGIDILTQRLNVHDAIHKCKSYIRYQYGAPLAWVELKIPAIKP